MCLSGHVVNDMIAILIFSDIYKIESCEAIYVNLISAAKPAEYRVTRNTIGAVWLRCRNVNGNALGYTE